LAGIDPEPSSIVIVVCASGDDRGHCGLREIGMARRYSKSVSKDVERAMEKRKKGTLRSGRSGKKVTSRKQAIAIGLSEARQKGKKVPKRKKRL
jgi:hypothetical protein